MRNASDSQYEYYEEEVEEEVDEEVLPANHFVAPVHVLDDSMQSKSIVTIQDPNNNLSMTHGVLDVHQMAAPNTQASKINHAKFDTTDVRQPAAAFLQDHKPGQVFSDFGNTEREDEEEK